MKIMGRISSIALMGSVMLCVALSTLAQSAVDHSLYAALLQKYLIDGSVDYKGLQADEELLDQYLALLAATHPETLSRNEQFALYINAYNAYTLKLIVEHYPVKSIKDIGSLFKSPWKIAFCRVDGKTYTLDDLEHSILRPQFKDPRVHFAINCASKGCPPLLAEPYQGDRLDQQLDASTRRFLNDPKNTILEGKTLSVSSIFKWFGGDFQNDPLTFVRQYAEGTLKQALDANAETIKVKYLDYDWSLNER